MNMQTFIAVITFSSDFKGLREVVVLIAHLGPVILGFCKLFKEIDLVTSVLVNPVSSSIS